MREMRPSSRKPSKPATEPKGLDAFAGKASNVRLVAVEPPKEQRWHQMNVRFTPEEHDTLQQLAQLEGRSMANVLRRLLAPVLKTARKKLGSS